MANLCMFECEFEFITSSCEKECLKTQIHKALE